MGKMLFDNKLIVQSVHDNLREEVRSGNYDINIFNRAKDLLLSLNNEKLNKNDILKVLYMCEMCINVILIEKFDKQDLEKLLKKRGLND